MSDLGKFTTEDLLEELQYRRGGQRMSFDIYGNNLRSGHCEVHPHIHEVYPCSQCLIERDIEQRRQAECYRQQEDCEKDQRIEQLEAALEDIVAADHCKGGEYCPHCIARNALAEDRE